MIECRCPECGRGFKLKDEIANRRGKCPDCGKIFVIPAAVLSATPAIIQSVETPDRASMPLGPAIEVTVDPKQGLHSSFGVASFVLGLLAFAGCWIPVINFGSLILGCIGVALGGIVSLKKQPGLGFAIPGLILSLLSIVVVIGMWVIVAGALRDVAGSPEDIGTPAAVADPERLEWVEVAKWSGTAGKNTETFHIASREWVVMWANRPLGSVGNLIVFTHKEGGKGMGGLAVNAITIANEMTHMRDGPGDFWLEIQSSNTAWGIVVHDQQPVAAAP